MADSKSPHLVTSQEKLFRKLDFHWFPGPPMGLRVKLSSHSDSPWSITSCPSVPGAKVCFLVRIQKKNKLEVSLHTNLTQTNVNVTPLLLTLMYTVKNKDNVKNETTVLESATTHEPSHRFRKTRKTF